MSRQEPDLERVAEVVREADAVAEVEESSAEDVLLAALAKVRRRGA